MDYKLKKKDFRIFIEEFRYWVDKFGLKGWEFFYQFEEEDCRACIQRDVQGRLVIVTLSKTFDVEPTDAMLKRCAFHEACELLLSPLVSLVTQRSVSDNQLEEATHNIIRIMENEFFVR